MFETRSSPFILETELPKPENKNADFYVRLSFTLTYILLLTTATITFIEALRTNIPRVRHILNLETCISVVAGYFYGVFLSKIDVCEKDGKKIDWADITRTRYIDWSITTPIMLLVLCVVLSSHTQKPIHLSTISTIIILNYVMLYIGYLGEIGTIPRFTAMMSGFVPFFTMFYIVYAAFVAPKYMFVNYVMYGVYIVVWALYGILFMFEENIKNIGMNILDCIAKCLIGNGLFLYYSNLIVL